VSGARIWLPGSVELPHEFELEIPKLGQVLKVSLRWSKGQTHGVMFLEELRGGAGDDVASLLEALRTPDDTSRQEVASAGFSLSAPEAPKRPATGWWRSLWLLLRKSSD
jgi:hypothetical protein